MEYALKQNHQTLSSRVSDDPIGWFEDMAENAVAVQTQTLRRILEQNLRVEYLQKWLGGKVRVQDLGDSEIESLYRKSVPLATHADFEPFIQRIADGETNPILTQKPITCLSLTSGTTEGRQKYVPFNMDCVNIRRTSLLVDSAFRSRAYPTKEGGKVLSFMYCNTKLPKTKGGLKVGSVSTLFLSSLAKAKKLSAECSPWEIASMGDHKQLTYCHFLLGLFFSEKVEFITSNFAHIMVHAFTSFENIWKDLCRDLSEGTLSPRVECPKMRKIVLEIINDSRNRSLASKIETKCRGLEVSDWSGLIPKLWPNAKYVRCITTGSMKHYAKKLRHYLGDLPMVCSWFISSESLVGLNANPSAEPDCVSFSIVPYASYFEFIPLHKEKLVTSNVSVGDSYTEDEPIPLSQTKVGQEYEIVLTTFTGLYRYRLGDLVEVVGFHKNTPRLKFICRSKVCLSINIDKTTEKDLEIVVERGSELLSKKTNTEMVDYTSHTNLENQPGNYVIYWEIKGDDIHDDESSNVVLQECCTEMDKLFGDICYIVSRRSNDIGPLELCIVKRGTFKRVFDCFVENGGNVGQFKTPRCTNNKAILGVLKERIVKRFHSTA